VKISRYFKAVVFQVTGLVLLVAAELIISSMRTQGNIEAGYFRSNTYLFITSIVLLGIGVYSTGAYYKTKQEHRADMIFFLLAGILLTVTSVVIFILYGGLEAPFDSSGFVAANVNITVVSILPVPFILRGLVLSLKRAEGKNWLKVLSLALSLIAVAAFVFAIVFGDVFRLVYFKDDYVFSKSYIDDISF